MDADAFAKLAPKKRLAPLIVLEGDEPFFKAEALRAVDEALEGAERLEVQAQKRGQDPAAILDELRSPSLFSPRKRVLIRDAEPFVAAAGEGLLAFAKAAPQGRVLVLDLKKLDKRTRLGQQLKKLGHLVACKPLYADPAPWQRGPAWDTELARWVVKRFAARGAEIGREDAFHLTRLTGNDLFEVDSTIDKLLLLVGEGKRVRSADLEAVAARTRKDSAFALADAIGDRDAGRALGLLRSAFGAGITTSGGTVRDAGGVGAICFGAVYRTFDELRRVRDHIERGGTTESKAMARELGIAPFAAPRAIRHAEAYAGVDLGGCWRALLRCDLGIKGAAGPQASLERLIAEVCAARGAAAPQRSRPR